MHKRTRWQFSLSAAVWITFWLYYDRSGDAMYSICAAVFHECGHLLSLALLRAAPERICVGAFGMRIERTQTTRLSFTDEQIIAAAGPAANLILALLLRLLCRYRVQLYRAVRVNLLLAAFNLLPIRPLDGGEFLYALLCRRMLPADARKWCKRIAAVAGIPSAAMAVWCFVHGRQNYSFLLSSLYVTSLLLASSM